MKKLRIGLIGFGAWVRGAYLPALAYDGRAIVTAVTASSEGTRKRAREILGEEVAVFKNYEELLRGAEIDAVMVAVPNHVHEEVLTAVIDSGLTVFYEPPISDTRRGILAMTERLQSASKITFAHLELSRHPGIARSVELIHENAIGILHHAAISLQADWGVPEESDLSLISSMSSWYVDVLNHIMQSVPNRVLVLDGCINTNRKQSISTGIYDYNGVWGIIKANINSPGGMAIQIEIEGSEGDIQLGYFTGELRYRNLGHTEWIVEDCTPKKPYADWPCVRETISAFLDAAEEKTASRGNAKAVVQLHMIGLAADESKDTGNWAEVKKIC